MQLTSIEKMKKKLERKKRDSPLIDKRDQVVAEYCAEARKAAPSASGYRSITTGKDKMVARARKGGMNTRDMYGREFYVWANKLRIHHGGWPKGKMRKPKQFAELATKALDKIPTLEPTTRKIMDDIIKVCTP